ncbi:YheC/YheD family protein [Lentibacillus salinarum]|uniref:YheC/YheD family protein n=1 Tax=Lentibacillus salinarum TaxID=446820 RepID=A0ABW3ZRB8_9BACI
MATLKEKQLPQTLNIIDTLIEAASHFTGLVKQKNLNQSIYIFSTIVDGFSAIANTLTTTHSVEIQTNKESIERSIHLIAKQMEQGNLLKVSEVIQFSLMPQLRALRQTFEADIPSEQVTQPITIGVYSSRANPRAAYSEERINAYVEEADRQGVGLIFFSSDDVDFDNKQINADVFKDHEWQKVAAPFPDVINNISPSSRIQQSRTERRLRRELPFTSFYVGNKFHLPKKLVKYRKYAHLLVPFKVCKNERIIHDFMLDNKIVVLKPIMGRRGENIFFVEKRGNRYALLDHKKEQIMGQETFNEWLDNVILRKKNSYLVQRYIHSRTKKDEPFHFRAHMQKNGKGEWQLTKIYPRVGNKKSNLSNIANEGRIEALGSFLEREFDHEGKEYEQKTLDIAMGLTRHLDNIHGLALDELGIDITIDDNGQFWLHEVNNGPQTLFHEKERAANTVAYATYLAKNGIVHTNELAERKLIKGQFDARTTDLPWAEPSERYRVGMLIRNGEPDDLAVSCANAAREKGLDFFYFTPKDLDFDEVLIRGHVYKNAEWVPKVVEYPDVIYDQLRMRGTKRYHSVYEELEDIPFTNELAPNSISRLSVFNHLAADRDLQNLIVPYKKIERPKDVFHFINQYGDVVLKPDRGASASKAHIISKLAIDNYLVTVGETEAHYNDINLTEYLRELIKKGSYIVLKHFGAVTDTNILLRVHMMKDGSGDWTVVSRQPVMEPDKSDNTLTGHNRKESEAENVPEQMDSLSFKVIASLEKFYQEQFNNVTFHFIFDETMTLYLFDVNFNMHGTNDLNGVEYIMAYAGYLAQGQI